MDEFRKEVIKELENVFGDGYQVLPYDKLKNNETTLHGICIHNENERISPVLYLEEYVLLYAAGKMTVKEIAAEMLDKYCMGDMPRNIADHVEDFQMMKDRVRIKVINYGANTRRLEQVPHRRFLDLAIVYYLDMDVSVEVGNVTIEIKNELMERWNVSESDLYRIGMENMTVKDSLHSDEIIGKVREMLQTQSCEEVEQTLKKFEKEAGPEAEIYLVSNKKRLFGACCLVNRPFLQELAECTESNLLIYPVSVTGVLACPVEKGNKNYLYVKEMQEINDCAENRVECLSNSIYLYDRVTREISIYKEGAPL